MTVQIRKPQTEDVEQIFDCLAAYNVHRLYDRKAVDPDFPVQAIVNLRNEISYIDFQEKCWVAVIDDIVIGFCCWAWLDPTELEAKTVLISVKPNARFLGVGAKLQEARQNEMVALGAKSIHTWTDAAADWYIQKFGYVLVDQEPICHCLHRISYGSTYAVWAIHRGLQDKDKLSHLVLHLARSY